MEYNVNRYIEMILSENQKQNLISRKDPVAEVKKHVLDSAQAVKLIDFNNKSVIDIGSGAGFPGMIIALMSRAKCITLLEADQKKSGFLIRVAEELKINNVEVVNERAEVLGRDVGRRGKYDLATCRAVAAASVLLEYALPMLKVGGQLIMWKSANYQIEMEEAGYALEAVGGKIENIIKYSLMEGLDRTLIVVKKNIETPEKYPRRTGIPGKRPL